MKEKHYLCNKFTYKYGTDKSRQTTIEGKEAMRREDYYRNTMMLSGAGVLLAEGYLTLEDVTDCREEVQAAIRLWARMDE